MSCRFYVTPKSFLDMLGLFSKMLGEQHSQLTGSRERLLNGLAKLNDTNAAVDGMQQQLNLLQPTLVQKTTSAEQLLAQVTCCPSRAVLCCAVLCFDLLCSCCAILKSGATCCCTLACGMLCPVLFILVLSSEHHSS